MLSKSVIALIISNIVAGYLVIESGEGFEVFLILYWAESGIVGFFTILKIMLCKNFTLTNRSGHPLAVNNFIFQIIIKIFFSIFFLFHFGGFMCGHGFFLFNFLIKGINNSHLLKWADIIEYIYFLKIPLLILFASHAFSFFYNYIYMKENLSSSIDKLMSAPYSRIVIMHITIIAGSFLIAITKERTTVIFLFIILKIVADVYGHLKERKRFQNSVMNHSI